MKAVRFIAILSFLSVFCPALLAQTDKNTKPVENKDKTPTVTSTSKDPLIPAEKLESIPISSPQERYRIGMYDVLEVNVYKHADYSQSSVKLDDNGRIRLPKINRMVTAVCKTENELAEEIMKLLEATYLVNPYVTVVVREQVSQPLAVVGAVKNPGRLFTNRRLTLLEVLAYAGGPDVEFAGNTVQVARVGDISGCVDKENGKVDGELLFFSYKLPDILKGKTNPLIKPGDIVSVLPADVVYISGNVNREGKVTMREPITLLQAIASAEGLKPASKSKVRILRQKEGSAEREELVFDLKEIQARKTEDPYLQPNDIVAVSEDPTKKILNGIANMIKSTIPNAVYRVPVP